MEKGLENAEILRNLSESTRNDILLHLLRESLIRTKLVPTRNSGILLSIIKKLRMETFAKNENIYIPGELADKMYFVV